MADYKLRLDVDAKLLEQALEKAVKKAFGKIPAMSGGGIGGGFGGGTSQQQTAANKERIKQFKFDKKFNIDEKKLLIKHLYDTKSAYAREKAALRAHNIMLEKSGAQAQRTFRMIGQLVGGRMGGSAGQVIDMGLQGLSKARSGRRQTRATKLAYDKMSKKDRRRYDAEHGGPPEAGGAYNSIMDQFDKAKGGMKGKFEGTERGKKMMENYNAFKGTKKGKALSGLTGAAEAGGKGGTQLVKLAGIGAALAGGAGLGKMIVDSSPMLKAMLKLLNVGVMLILRPIGDFIGFMLRPLLLKFVTKVAIPAYKQGAGLAKEWGTKMSKVLLLLFTNPQEFLKGAVIDPLLGSLAKMGANIQRKLMEIAAYVNPMFLFDSAGRDEELNRIITTKYDGSNPLSDQAINKKYPGFWYDDNGLEGGLLGGMKDTEIGKNLQELQEMTTEELNMGNAKTDKVIENTKAAGDAVSDLEDKVIIGNEHTEDIAANTAEMVRLAEEAAAREAAAAAEAAAEIERTNINNAKMDNIMDDQKTFFEENPYIRNTILGSQAIQDEGEKKKQDAVDAYQMKKYGQLINEDGELHVNIASLSPEAQKRLAAANNYKIGAPGSGTCPVVGSRKGFYNSPISAGDMGQYYESERYRTGTGAAVGEGCYLQVDAEYRSYGVETRAGAEMYTEAIKAAAENGTEVLDEWDIMVEESAAAARDATKIADNQEVVQNLLLDKNNEILDAAFESAQKASEGLDEHKEIFNLTAQSKDLTCLSTKLTEDSMKMIEKAHKSVKNLLKSIGISTPTKPIPSEPETDDDDDDDGGGSHYSDLTKYKVLFADGDPLEKLLTAREKMTFQSHINNGTVHPSYTDRGVVKSISKMARGGIIGEKIFGIGESGQQYMFGESGPETVTPGVGGTVNNRGGSTFNITINASDVGDIERQLKPAILKMLKESTSRAGIV